MTVCGWDEQSVWEEMKAAHTSVTSQLRQPVCIPGVASGPTASLLPVATGNIQIHYREEVVSERCCLATIFLTLQKKAWVQKQTKLLPMDML